MSRRASLILIPVMSSRFVLSLKKAGSESTIPSSLPTFELDTIIWADGRNVQQESQVFDVLGGIPGTSAALDQGDVELSSIPPSRLASGADATDLVRPHSSSELRCGIHDQWKSA